MLITIAYAYSILKGDLLALAGVSAIAFLHVLFRVSGIEPGILNYSIGAALVLALPLAAYMSALMIERYVTPLKNYQAISKLAFVLTCVYCMQSAELVDYMASAVQLIKGRASLEPVVLFIRISAACLLGAAVVAFTLYFLLMLIELPFLWLASALSYTRQADLTLAGARPLAFFLISVFLYNVFVDYFARKLWPAVFNF